MFESFRNRHSFDAHLISAVFLILERIKICISGIQDKDITVLEPAFSLHP
jgi:hypothetical protein